MPGLCGSPTETESLYKSKEPLFNLELEVSVCLTNTESAKFKKGMVSMTVEIEGEGISRVQDPDWLEYLDKRVIVVFWAQGQLVFLSNLIKWLEYEVLPFRLWPSQGGVSFWLFLEPFAASQ